MPELKKRSLFIQRYFSAQLSFLFSIASAEEELLDRALGASTNAEESAPPSVNLTPSMDFAQMSEDEQIAYAMRLSMDPGGENFLFHRSY